MADLIAVISFSNNTVISIIYWTNSEVLGKSVAIYARLREATMARLLGIAVLSLLGSLVLPSAVTAQQPTVLHVSNSDPVCGGQSPCYTTIQAAINAATSRGTIRVQAGTYTEQLQIQKNDFVSANESDRIVIEADPAAAPGSVVLSGGGSSSCTNNFAIRFKQSKYVTVRDLAITGFGGQAITLMGGNNGNVGIHITGNRIFDNGYNNSCDGGITVARENPDTLIVNNLVYGNGRNGINFIDADGGPHHVVNNTIYGNGWNGVNIARNHHVVLANNIIFQNGLASGTTGGRFGIQRESSPNPHPADVTLYNNLICANTSGQINGPALDGTDASNLTPTGNEGPGVSGSPDCQNISMVFSNLRGADNILNTADDDPNIIATSPAIDAGIDTRTLGLNALFNSILEADLYIDITRPRDGNRSRSAEFDIGAIEYIAANQAPVANAGQNRTVTEGTLVVVDGSSSHDPDDDALLYEWSQISGPAVILSNPLTNTSTFTAPQVAAPTDLIFQLTVNDWATSSSASVRITVVKANRPPVLSAIGNKTVSVGNTLTFTLSASDPDNDPLTYSVSPLPLPANVSFDTSARSFTFTPAGNQVGSFNLTFALSDGRGGTASETVAITVTGGLAISITSPANGATVPAGQLIVRGTVTNSGGGDIGVSINGVPAAVRGGSFTALLFATAQTTEISAIATTTSGGTTGDTITIAVTGVASSLLTMRADPFSGPAPLFVNFKLVSDAPVIQVSLDANGDGVIDYTGPLMDQFPITFTQPGVYLANATVVTAQGNQLTASALVQIFDATQLDGILRAKWAAMKDALRVGDIEAALNQVAQRARSRYQEGFIIISNQLGNIDQILTNISLIEFREDEAIYDATRIDDGISMAFEIRFVIDGDGVWRIRSF